MFNICDADVMKKRANRNVSRCTVAVLYYRANAIVINYRQVCSGA